MKILKDGAVYIIGEITSKAMPFLLLPYFTRTLGAEGFGELSYYLAFIMLASIFIGLSQEGSITRYFYFYGKKSIGLIVSCGFIYSTLLSMILITTALVFKAYIVVLIIVSAWSNSILAVQLALRQCQKKAKSYVLIQLASGIVSAALTVILFEFFEANFIGRIIAIIISNLVCGYIAFRLLSKDNYKFIFTMKKLKLGFSYIFAFGIPLIFHQMSFFFKGQFDRIFVYEYFSEQALGVYAAAFQLASILSVVVIALNKAFVPYFQQALKQKTIDFSDVSYWFKLSFIFVPIPVFVAYLIPETWYLFILGSGFDGVKIFTLFFLIGMALLVPYLIMVNYLFYYGQNSKIAQCTLSSALIYVACIFYLKDLGIHFVPFALVISNLLTPLLLFYIAKNKVSTTKS